MTTVGLVVRDVGPMGGIGRYTRELALGLLESERVQGRVIVLGEPRRPWPADVRLVPRRRGPLGGSRALRDLGELGRADVLHFPLHETTPFFAALRPPIVMTIHSVEPLYLRPAELGVVRRRRILHKAPYRLLRALRRSLRIVVTPSEVEAREIERHLRVPAERIRAIPHGVDHAVFSPLPDAAQAVAEEFGVSGPYVLYVGHHQPQKNVARLIEAYARAARDDAELVIAGDITRCADEYRALVEHLRLADRIRFLGPVVDDHALARLYAAAAAFVFPSLHESFGLPALEAMACGCPVVAARGSGLEETVGNAGLLVDPRDTGDLAGALERVLGDRELARRLSELGLAHAARFTWQRSLEAHLDAYEAAAA